MFTFAAPPCGFLLGETPAAALRELTVIGARLLLAGDGSCFRVGRGEASDLVRGTAFRRGTAGELLARVVVRVLGTAGLFRLTGAGDFFTAPLLLPFENCSFTGAWSFPFPV